MEDRPVATHQSHPGSSIASPNLGPGLNVFLRCPLPQVWDAPSDSLRQYWHGNVVPQVRILTPYPVSPNGGGTTINHVTSIGPTSSGGGSSATATLAITNISTKTPVINPGASFTGSFTLSKVFQLLSLSSSNPSRIRLYGTATEQAADSFRGLDISPPAGTAQNIICDVALDTAPFLWSFQDRVGSNRDNPATSTIYITVTNLEAISDSFTLTFEYVPVVV